MALKKYLAIAVLPLGLGCQKERTDLMPLEEGSHWTYLVRSVDSYSNRVTVARRIAIGETNGYELTSNLGISHLGWSRGKLISDEMAGARFTPPISILAPGTEKVEWAGWVDWGDKREPAKAETTGAPASLEVNGVKTTTVQSAVTMKLPNRRIDLKNWFKPGIGLVRQEQLTNGRVDVIIEYLDRS